MRPSRNRRAVSRWLGLVALVALVVAALASLLGLPVEATRDGNRAGVAMQDVRAAEGAEQAAPLTLLLATEPVRSPTGQPVTFVLAVDNPSGAEANLTFSSSQVYDVVVHNGDAEVWRWSYDKGFAAALTDRVYPPGVTLLDRVQWDWRDANGGPVPSGRYRAVASLKTIPPRQGSAVELTLEAP